MATQNRIDTLKAQYEAFVDCRTEMEKDYEEARDKLLHNSCGMKELDDFLIMKNSCLNYYQNWINAVRDFLFGEGLITDPGDLVTFSIFGETFYSGPDYVHNIKRFKQIYVVVEK